MSGSDAGCWHLIYAPDEPGRTLSREQAGTGTYPVAAIAGYRRSGGRVAVVATWRAFTDGTLRMKGYANRRFLERLLDWLLEMNSDTYGVFDGLHRVASV